MKVSRSTVHDFVILVYILVSLYTFLKYLCIDVERKHVLFGDVKDFIHNTMVKQKYLTVETDKQNSKNSFSWGPRAECSISKHKVLEFACKVSYIVA